MPSTAFEKWAGERGDRLDSLVQTHALLGPAGVGRRWRTQQINDSLMLRLATEFQGFARELHTEGASFFARNAAAGNRPLESAISTLLTQGRKLDSGNANPGNLGADFGRFGIQWWPAMAARTQRTRSRQEMLDNLNKARNAIVHDNPHEIADLRNEGFPITLKTFVRCRRALNRLAITMDETLALHLDRFFGAGRPW